MYTFLNLLLCLFPGDQEVLRSDASTTTVCIWSIVSVVFVLVFSVLPVDLS